MVYYANIYVLPYNTMWNEATSEFLKGALLFFVLYTQLHKVLLACDIVQCCE